TYVNVLETQLKAVDAPARVTTVPLHKSIAKLRKSAIHITKSAKEAKVNLKLRRCLNDRLVMAERAFTDSLGLPGNPWYKHM
ncbi:hypothetical protein KI387_021824, partial [Taxus chinensis]